MISLWVRGWMQLRVSAQGRVQGVGFRPSVYRLALALGLSGHVRNMGNGNVEILLDGEKATIDVFLAKLRASLPPLAEIFTLNTQEVVQNRREGFHILESGIPDEAASVSFIPQDVATCDLCLAELTNPQDRRHGYPFVTCTDCGPRFTISRGAPFDRDNTSMKPFTLCRDCLAEYTDPGDRRYHAQTISCPACGPKVWLIGPEGHRIRCSDPVRRAATLLGRGHLVAIKGIGGSHLACGVLEDRPIRRLRRILKRPYQPFAIMARSLQDARTFAVVGQREEEALTDWRRPIVVLDKREPFPLSSMLAPDLGNIGVMLPYTPLHHMVLAASKEPALVMTSANVHDEPMILEAARLRDRLRGIDYILWHDREIVNRCDDSVVRFHQSHPVMIRRSRGYVPHPIPLPWKGEKAVLGVGPELSSTACIAKDGLAYLTQHIGNTSNFDTFNYLKDAISALMRTTNTLRLDAVAHDLHPAFLSTKLAQSLAERWSCPAFPVQHHFAHLHSVMAENGIDRDKQVLGIVCDGVGYGTPNQAWGGEILAVGPKTERMAFLKPQPLIGGDLAAIYPIRMLVGILSQVYEEKRISRLIRRFCFDGLAKGERELGLILRQLQTGYNVSYTTSTGRILDAISVLLGISFRRTYEGEGAMRLEGVAGRGDGEAVDIPVVVERWEGRYILNTTALVQGAVEALEHRRSREDVAASSQTAIARGLAELADLCAEDLAPDAVAASGGVMYNRQIVSVMEANLGRELVKHVYLPPGDGCVSLGQVAAAQVLMDS